MAREIREISKTGQRQESPHRLPERERRKCYQFVRTIARTRDLEKCGLAKWEEPVLVAIVDDQFSHRHFLVFQRLLG